MLGYFWGREGVVLKLATITYPTAQIHSIWIYILIENVVVMRAHLLDPKREYIGLLSGLML